MTEEMLVRAAELGGREFGSARQLAAAAGLSPSTTANIVAGRAEGVRPATAAALAAAWGISEEKVYQLVRGTTARIEPFRGPDGSESLTPYQREAVTKVINAFIRDNDRGAHHGEEAEKKTEPAAPHALGRDSGAEEKTPDGPTRADMRLAARRGIKFDRKQR